MSQKNTYVYLSRDFEEFVSYWDCRGNTLAKTLALKLIGEGAMNTYMKTISQAGEINRVNSAEKGFAIETTFVLFFLAIEFGMTIGTLGFETAIFAFTLILFVVAPYFLQSEDKPNFAKWLIGRSVITIFAVGLGLMFRQTLGTVLPETFRFLPMTLLIVTAMISCYIQFYSFFRLREVK